MLSNKGGMWMWKSLSLQQHLALQLLMGCSLCCELMSQLICITWPTTPQNV
jgi:hypothetical protein